MKRTIEKILALILVTFILSGCVSIEATPYDSENKCWGEPEVVDTSFNADTSCGGSVTLAKDEQGNIWRFDTTCLPSGFNEVGSAHEILFSPPCDEN